MRRTVVTALGWMLGALALSAAVPAAAQNSQEPVDVTAAPPPSPDTVGPSQLRNFSLGGTVTKPSERPATTAPAQPTSPPAAAQAQPAAPQPAAGRASPGRIALQGPSIPAPTRSFAPNASANFASEAEGITPSRPTDVAMEATGAVAVDDSLLPDAASSSSRGWSWPWIAALIALIGGGAFIGWSRLSRDRRAEDPGRLAFAGLVPEAEAKPAPLPPVRPRPDPVPPRGAAPSAPPAAPKPVNDGLVVSTRLKPALSLQFTPDRAVVTEQDVILQFDVQVFNSGSAAARDVLVEARLVSAHAGQDEEIALFFQRPAGTGDRMATIPPLSHVQLKSQVRLPLDSVHSFEVDGRQLFVPLVAFNVYYAGGGHASASFMVGRGTEEDEKLAPFRLDLGPRIFRGLSARAHSAGLSA